MRDEVKLTILFGRLLDLLARGPETTDDHRAALRALVALVAGRSMTVVVADGQVTVEGFAVPDDTPFTDVVRARFALHDIARVLIACGASAVDLAQVLRALAAPPTSAPAASLTERLRQGKVATVAIVASDLESAHLARRDTRITEALGAPGRHPAGSAPGDESDAPVLLAELDQVQHGLAKALDSGELHQAIEVILRLVRQERDAVTPEAQRAYGIVLRRVLTTDTLRRFAPYIFDEVYHDDIVMMMRRAGTQGTKTLLALLIEAPSQAERRACLRALRMLEEGMDVIASLLDHHEWFVVRNAADLVGELRIAEATAALGKLVGHDDPRVRRSAGLALARIGTPETALHLRKALADSDPGVRMAVVKEVGGRALGGLAMPLVSAAEAERDLDVLAEFYRALGRIGTPDAVQALIKASAGKGLLSRKPLGPRLAAIEALGTAGTPSAVEALEQLAARGHGDVRAAATAALEQARASVE